MNCGRCHNPMTFAQPAQQWWCGYCRYYAGGVVGGVAPPGAAEDAHKARKLVNLSHIFGWGGLGLLILGPILAASLRLGGKVGGGLAIVGVLSAIAGAILGQIGRAMQGRVI
jgi:hypothetical protein